MWLLNLFKRKKKPKLNLSAKITVNDEVDPIYLEKLDNGLVPGEIVLMDWIDGKPYDAKIPGYFEYTYGINTDTSIETLQSMELLEYTSPKNSLISLKVNELKGILRDNELKVSGKKQDLIDRITKELSDEEIENYIKHPPLALSDEGKLTLEKYYYIVPAHKHQSNDGVYSVATAIDFMNNHNLNFTPTSRDISWALFQQDYLKNHQNKMYGLARNNLLSMARQVYRENKLDYALKFYLDVCIMDLSGLANNATLSNPDLTNLAIGITDEIKHISNKQNINKQNINKHKFKEIYDESWSNTRQSIPFHYLSKEECYLCIEHAINGESKRIYEVIKEKFDKLDKDKFEEIYNLKLPVSVQFDS